MARLWTFLTVIPALSSVQGLVKAIEYPACSSISPCKLKSCRALPTESAAACSSFFSQHDINATTCISQPTVYVTSTVQPTITQINSAAETAHVNSTALFHVLTTVNDTVTSVPTTTLTSSITVVSTETQTITSSVPTYPWWDTCTQAPNVKRNLIQAAPVIPKDCSCYLTDIISTDPATITATSYLPAITTIISNTPFVTVTHLLNETFTQTLTSTTTVDITATTVVPSITTSVTTSSVTTTVTHIGVPETCSDIFTFTGQNAFFYSGVVARTIIQTSDVTSCCTACYQTHSCANFVWKPSTQECLVYLADSQTDSCFNDYCPNGRPSGTFSPDADSSNRYGPGPCGGGIVR